MKPRTKPARELIPSHWTSEDALLVSSFLEALLDAINERYRTELHIDLRRRPCLAERTLPGARANAKGCGDDFPF
jgi:hypothetical protein